MRRKIKDLCLKMRTHGIVLTVLNALASHMQKFIPETMMEPIYCYKHRIIEKRLKPFVISIITNQKGIKETDVKICQNNAIFEKEPIWVCWLQGEDKMPDLVKTCYRSIRKCSSGHPVILITSDNLERYVNIDEKIINKYQRGVLKHAHFSDIIRLNLLARYGGLWVDATIYCSDPIDEKVFATNFHSVGGLRSERYVANGRWSTFFLSSQSSSKAIEIIKIVYEAYIINEDCLIDYLLFDYLIDLFCKIDPNFKHTVESGIIKQPDLMSLQPLLSKRYDSKVWEKMTRSTNFFKLSWKEYSDDELNNMGENSYYAYIKSLV